MFGVVARRVHRSSTTVVLNRQSLSFWSNLFGDEKSTISRALVPATVPALIEAVKEKDEATIKALARRDASLIREQTPDDNTALHEAAKAGDVETLKLLAEVFGDDFTKGLNQRCHCFIQRVAVHYAVEGGHQDAVEFLVGQGAKLNIQDERGRTSLDYALEAGNCKLALYIHKEGGTANKEKQAALALPKAAALSVFTEKFNAEAEARKDEAFDAFVTDYVPTKK